MVPGISSSKSKQGGRVQRRLARLRLIELNPPYTMLEVTG